MNNDVLYRVAKKMLKKITFLTQIVFIIESKNWR